MYNLEYALVMFAKTYADILNLQIKTMDMEVRALHFIHRTERTYGYTYTHQGSNLQRTPIQEPFPDSGSTCPCPWYVGIEVQTPNGVKTLDMHCTPFSSDKAKALHIGVNVAAHVAELRDGYTTAPGRIPPHNGEYN